LRGKCRFTPYFWLSCNLLIIIYIF
jgi:hypothetical protein